MNKLVVRSIYTNVKFFWNYRHSFFLNAFHKVLASLHCNLMCAGGRKVFGKGYCVRHRVCGKHGNNLFVHYSGIAFVQSGFVWWAVWCIKSVPYQADGTQIWVLWRRAKLICWWKWRRRRSAHGNLTALLFHDPNAVLRDVQHHVVLFWKVSKYFEVP